MTELYSNNSNSFVLQFYLKHAFEHQTTREGKKMNKRKRFNLSTWPANSNIKLINDHVLVIIKSYCIFSSITIFLNDISRTNLIVLIIKISMHLFKYIISLKETSTDFLIFVSIGILMHLIWDWGYQQWLAYYTSWLSAMVGSPTYIVPLEWDGHLLLQYVLHKLLEN